MNPSFTIIDLQQGTQEWRRWRHGGIGASEASIIMGENPFKNIAELLEEKRGPVSNHAPNAAMALGTALEPVARRRYVAEMGRLVRPICAQSRKQPWLRGSLDGYCPLTRRAVEIKCGRSAYWTTRKVRTVPILYYGQCQQIMAIMDLSELDFFCHWPGFPDVYFAVERDNKYISRLMVKGQEFWNSVQHQRTGAAVQCCRASKCSPKSIE